MDVVCGRMELSDEEVCGLRDEKGLAFPAFEKPLAALALGKGCATATNSGPIFLYFCRLLSDQLNCRAAVI